MSYWEKNMNDQAENIKTELLTQQIVGKIYTEVQKLTTSEQSIKKIYQQRWIWELIQNAVDCKINQKPINIKINFNEESKILTFAHDGVGFSLKNIWSLVTQTSSKQTDDVKTGEFGTGFITTTVLSPQITIKSYIVDKGNTFEITIDRSGSTYEEIDSAVSNNIRTLEQISNYTGESCDRKETKFVYNLSASNDLEKSIIAVKEGLKNLKTHIAYLLTINNSIGTITINDIKYTVQENKQVRNLPTAQICIIKNTHDANKLYVFKYNSEHTSLLAPVQFNSSTNTLSFGAILPESVRLFCVFPLLNTNEFYFPMILNSDQFKTKMDRDGIYMTDANNVSLLNEASIAYKKILNTYKIFPTANIYNLCDINDSDPFTTYEWKNSIQNEINCQPMVLTNKNTLISIYDEKGKKQVYVPASKKEQNFQDVYDVVKELADIHITSFPYSTGWREIINNNIFLSDIQKKYFEGKSINDLNLENNTPLDWLNRYYSVLDKDQEQINMSTLFLNAENMFEPFSDLKKLDGHSDLLDILITITPEIEKKLLHYSIDLPNRYNAKISKLTDNAMAQFIEGKALEYIGRNNFQTNSETLPDFFEAILKFFSKNKELSAQLFPTLYNERSKLHSNSFSEELNQIGDIITEKEISLTSLKQIVSSDQLLATLIGDEENLGTEMIQKLSHIVSSTPYSGKIFESLIERSISDVYMEFVKNPNYEVPDTIEKWKSSQLSKTVFPVKKESRELYVVIRPSDGDRIIFYEDQEIDVLSNATFELWTDNGTDVRQITLGDILKTTQITEVPLKKLF